ncbi:UbiH/UbiF/VisC/COQ6 family ubiquinone biosynthesis hydroxylase [Sphingomonas sp. BIUV-7]|uniref:UbiH/UbiF/VisC/COQ6 family ubiquinone biosynthesis hydroxylase n=1 Tax=Sphingomonas natans TaxID=3063330 RepID=A0ABT8Y4N7_9SPHN|nr:UbiH/UbiF/VisC/COQ6 family ubiquinone biosynthesis hydroxylase [Sphingomonas sp. BIUV-7]MDO6413285.1 UbiH/UbiF/VisC/COQ6 family ubiquinone biosynthesis hydroxylase [Sphingomonas sp. BIUV-7]
MNRADVIILGGGLVGLTLALALDRHEISSIVVDPVDPATVQVAGFDGRASAIASASWKMLEAIGLGERLAGQGCPIRAIRAADGLTPRALVFDTSDEEGPLGIMFENRLLRRTLHAAVADAKHITLLAPARPVTTIRDETKVTVTLDDGTIITTPLLVAAEGRHSPTREAAGIEVARWRYDHAAIIATLGHEMPHGNIAHELFYPSGPFALLPMLDDADGHRSAIVWTVAGKDAEAMMGLPDRAFLAEAEKRMGGMLGALRAASPRSSYALGFHHAARITDTRLALVGDAAHGIHPIAGQGLNLGLRDVAALTEVLVDGLRLGLDTGDAQLLARYQSWRALDTFLVAAATDSLTRLYGIPGPTAREVRRFGMDVVERVAPLKRMFMAEARGESGALPKLLQGVEV